jgi:hypothetical protein
MKVKVERSTFLHHTNTHSSLQNPIQFTFIHSFDFSTKNNNNSVMISLQHLYCPCLKKVRDLSLSLLLPLTCVKQS